MNWAATGGYKIPAISSIAAHKKNIYFWSIVNENLLIVASIKVSCCKHWCWNKCVLRFFRLIQDGMLMYVVLGQVMVNILWCLTITVLTDYACDCCLDCFQRELIDFRQADNSAVSWLAWTWILYSSTDTMFSYGAITCHHASLRATLECSAGTQTIKSWL